MSKARVLIKAASGEGETPRDALEALAHGFLAEQVDTSRDGKVTIRLERTRVKALRGDDYDGFVAQVIEEGGPSR